MMKLLIDTNNINDLKQWDDIIFYYDFDEDIYFSLCGTISNILKLYGKYGNVEKINFKLYCYDYINKQKYNSCDYFLIIKWDCENATGLLKIIYFDYDDLGCHVGDCVENTIVDIFDDMGV